MAQAVAKDKKEAKQEWLNEEILIEFMNLEEPGAPLKFVYGKGRRTERFLLLHGGKYKLRREVVEHIESRRTPIWKYQPNGQGFMDKTLTGHKSRFQCRQIFEG